MLENKTRLSATSERAFWLEVDSIEKTAGLAHIVAGILRKASANKAADAVLEYGNKASDLATAALLTELPGPRILPKKWLRGMAETVADNPHLIPVMPVPIPGFTEGTLLATKGLERALNVEPAVSPARREITREFMRRRVPKAPWVDPLERYSDRVEEDLSTLYKRLVGR